MGINNTTTIRPSGPQGRWLGPLAAVVLAVWSAGVLATPPQRAVATTLAQAGPAQGGLRLDGVLEPLHQATLSSQVGGNVLQLAVKAGDSVRAGQLVARLDGRELGAAVQASQAAVAQALAQWRQAQAQFERSRSLQAQGFLSPAALDMADMAAKAAAAALQQAEAGQRQSQLTQGHAQVLAPFDGVVLATLLAAGDLATPGRGIATVYVPGSLRAVVQVPASLAAAARGAGTVQVLLADGRRITPLAQQWLPGADAVSQTLTWRLDLPAAAATGLSPGQAVQVLADGGAPATGTAPAAMLLPASAVLQRGELTAVYVVQGQRFVLRAVRTGGPRGAAGIPVLAGLKAGERVALDAVQAGLAGAVPAP